MKMAARIVGIAFNGAGESRQGPVLVALVPKGDAQVMERINQAGGNLHCCCKRLDGMVQFTFAQSCTTEKVKDTGIVGIDFGEFGEIPGGNLGPA